MSAQVAVKEQEIILSCNEAQLLLRTIPLDIVIDESEEISDEQRAAAKHCAVICNECIKKGFREILGTEVLSCKEALETWSCVDLDRCFLGFPGGEAQTLREKLAIEHIFGRQLIIDHQNPEPHYHRYFFNRFEICNEKQCESAVRLVLGNLHAEGDLPGVYREFLLELFLRNGWELDDILKSLNIPSTECEDVQQLHTLKWAQRLAKWWVEHPDASKETPFAKLAIDLQNDVLSEAPQALREFIENRCAGEESKRFAWVFEDEKKKSAIT